MQNANQGGFVSWQASPAKQKPGGLDQLAGSRSGSGSARPGRGLDLQSTVKSIGNRQGMN
jgi:hypothetical protein